MKEKDPRQYYPFRVGVSLLVTFMAGFFWATLLWNPLPLPRFLNPTFWALVFTALLPVALYWQHRLYRRHIRNVLFLLDAIENNDNSIHFNEDDHNRENRIVNRALNKVACILHNVKKETIQKEKYYELILGCVNTGIVVLNENGAVYQKNDEALRLLGINVFTHVKQLSRVDSRLTDTISQCRPGDKLQIAFSNERGTVNLSVRVSGIVVRDESLRILALNDINNELDEKEIDSWIRLTRVLTHEIMNAMTPITSLSDTLLHLVAQPGKADEASTPTVEEEIRNGLQTISSTGKGLLAFVETYRKFTRIPTPEPSLFYAKGFITRMIELARHQHPDAHITFQTDVAPEDLIIYADENLIAQVVINILKNAIQAIESSPNKEADTGCIRIRAYCNDSEAIFIEISNNGPQIPQEIAEHIFIPFFTTKEGGSGIGLSISRQIMRLSGGSISLLPGKKTTFVLKFN
ncbi:sensor histidine kinase [Bacteroides ndongoniae]|uniref:sensor histidine kinase n=1 Tax=Bacteroides ndongoniae TaxID=1903262 RepID=UPI0008DB28A2|nr:ATP-binding protein [Bacteroides ndongoniae]